jgi:hypothetical protein
MSNPNPTADLENLKEEDKDVDWDLEAKQMREDEDEKFDRDMEDACVPDYTQ